MGRLFGTDGVRGVANDDLSPELALRLGRAAAAVLAQAAGGRPRVLMGRDTRASGDLLEAALAAGLMSAGADVVPLGVITTPGVAFLTAQLGATAGAVISASHNPPEYNGIKFFSAEGRKLPDALEEEIESLIAAEPSAGAGAGLPAPVGGAVGRRQPEAAAAERYIEHLRSVVRSDLRGLRVVVDCAHGAAYRLAPEVWRRLGVRLTVLNDRPDGTNINVDCGSTSPEKLAEAVVREGADLGVAYDGDGDRVIAVDERGRVVDGDAILAVLARDLLARDALPHRTVVATVMSNLGLERALAAAGARLVRTKVGDRYVFEAMEAGGYVLGGEQSGHIILRQYAQTGDGILTGLVLADVMVRSGKPLSELASVVQPVPQVLVNVRVARKDGWEQEPAIRTAIRRAEERLGDAGRVLVRASGTEPLIRVMVEGDDEALVRELAGEIAGAVRHALGTG
ncbi:MAG TPA: phosphoglucosamine mutase [Thermaerobacter sp.]